jgi:acyl dehydratase
MNPPIKFRPIDRADIAKYAKASGDFNRIHLDEEFAKTAGLPSVIAHGMLSMGVASAALLQWKIPKERVKSYSARFKDKVFPGDKLVAEFLAHHRSEDQESFRWRLVKETGEEVLSAEVLLHPE